MMWNKRKEKPFHHTNKDYCVGDTTPSEKKTWNEHYIIIFSLYFPISLLTLLFTTVQFSRQHYEIAKKGSQSILFFIYFVCVQSQSHVEKHKIYINVYTSRIQGRQRRMSEANLVQNSMLPQHLYYTKAPEQRIKT